MLSIQCSASLEKVSQPVYSRGSYPQTALSTKNLCQWARKTRSDKSTQCHETPDQLLELRRYVVSHRRFGIWVPEDSHKRDHCLDTADEAKVNSILEWGERHENDCQHTFPICPKALVVCSCHDGTIAAGEWVYTWNKIGSNEETDGSILHMPLWVALPASPSCNHSTFVVADQLPIVYL